VELLIEANVSEKRTISIFRAEVRFSETLASTSQSTRRPNPEEHHQYRHRRENLKSQILIYLLLLVCACVLYRSK
jgi:hypothetical protein